MDDRLARVRRQTGGPFTAAQAIKAGFATAEMRRLLRRGEWVTLRRGVYAEQPLLAEVATDDERRHALAVAALLLVLAHPAVAASHSAARILGLEFLNWPPDELVVASSHPKVRGERRDGYVLRLAGLPENQLRVRHGVPITAAARTVVDLAGELPFKDAVVLADSALRLGRASMRQLREVLHDCSGWPGTRAAQEVVAFADKKSGSVLESVSRVGFREQGLPAPQTQVAIGDEWEQYGEVDFLWDEFNVIGEADGLAKYEPDGRRSTRDKIKAEKRREERLLDAGYEIVRWGWEDATDPPRLARRLRAAFARGLERKRGRSSGRSR
jgi:hypothetical protein